MTTKSPEEIEAEVKDLRAKLEKFRKKAAHFTELEDQLNQTLSNLSIHQEELRTQNDELLLTREKLETLLNKYSLLFLDSPVSYFVIDQRQQIVEANHASGDMLGLRTDQLTWKPLFIFVEKEMRNALHSHYKRVFERDHASDEFTLLDRNKQPIHCLFESRLTRNPETDKTQSLTVVFDITERKKAEERIAELAEQNARILDSAGEGIIGLDKDGHITFANPVAATLLEEDVEDLFSRDLWAVLRPRSSDGDPMLREESFIHQTFEEGQTQTANHYFFLSRRGHLFPAEFTISPTFHENGVSGAVFTFRDITERKEYEATLKKAKEAAEAANIAKSAFLATMSHEIRTPMNAIVGMADMIDDSMLKEERDEATTIIKESGHSLLTLINDILDLARIEAGEVGIAEEVFAPREILQSVYGIMRHPAEVKKGLELIRTVDPRTPYMVKGDHRRIRQILINLIGNAIKFTDKGKIEIVLGVDMQGDKEGLQFSVRDTGIGIPEDKKEQIFDSFVQADSSTQRIYGGTGLGLAISQKLVKILGGRIWVDSMEGKGSAFSFTAPFPFIDDDLYPEESESDASSSLAAPRPTLPEGFPPNSRILIAEDDPINQLVLLKTFQRMGLSPTLACNGKEALQMASKGDYDLVFMDVQMPEMDGITAVERLRAMERSNGHDRHTTVVALTANALEGDRKACLGAGMDDYLCKPVQARDLKGILHRWLGDEESAAELARKPPVLSDFAVLDTSVIRELREDVGDEFQTVGRLYVMALSERIESLQQAVVNGDSEALSKAAFELKSSSRQLGVMRVAMLAEELERLGRAGMTTHVDADELARMIKEEALKAEQKVSELVRMN